MKRLLLAALLLIPFAAPSLQAMTREQAMETLMQAGADGKEAVDIAWGLCEFMPGRADNTHLYNVAVYLAVQVGGGSYGTGFSKLPIHDVAVSAQIILNYETYVRLLPGH